MAGIRGQSAQEVVLFKTGFVPKNTLGEQARIQELEARDVHFAQTKKLGQVSMICKLFIPKLQEKLMDGIQRCLDLVHIKK
jgi:hypothetical protein